MAIYHGVTPIHLNVPTTVDGTIDRMTQELVDRGICSLGDLVVVTAKKSADCFGRDRHVASGQSVKDVRRFALRTFDFGS